MTSNIDRLSYLGLFASVVGRVIVPQLAMAASFGAATAYIKHKEDETLDVKNLFMSYTLGGGIGLLANDVVLLPPAIAILNLARPSKK